MFDDQLRSVPLQATYRIIRILAHEGTAECEDTGGLRRFQKSSENKAILF